MAKRDDTAELRETLEGLIRLHGWQGELLGHVAALLGGQPETKCCTPAASGGPIPLRRPAGLADHAGTANRGTQRLRRRRAKPVT